MNTVSCPRCREEVIAPERASGEARVRCPLCQEEYTLGEALKDAPPMLVLLDDPNEADYALREEPAEAAAPAASEFAFADTAAAEPAEHAGFSFDDASADTAAAPKTTARTARPKRKQKSALGEVVKIAAGGIVGILLAILIMWWGLGKDPFDLGPVVSPYTPWIVPADFQAVLDTDGEGALAENGPDEGGQENEAEENDLAATNNGGGFGFSNPDIDNQNIAPQNGGQANPAPQQPQNPESPDDTQAGEGGLVTGLPELPEETAPQPPSLFEPDDDVSIDLDDSLASDPLEPNSLKPSDNPGLEVNPEPSLDSDLAAEPMPEASSPSPDSGPTEAPASAGLQVEGAPSFGVETLTDALQEAATADQAWTSAEDDIDVESRKKLAADLYSAAARLGELTAFADVSEEPVQLRMESVRQFLQGASQEGKTTDLIGQAGGGWLRASGRPNDGAALYGKVASVEEQEGYFQSQLGLANRDKTPVVVLSKQKPSFQTGDSVLLLGAIVENPAEKVESYQGDAEQVVVYGQSLVVE